jgi:hypothetical protein
MRLTRPASSARGRGDIAPAYAINRDYVVSAPVGDLHREGFCPSIARSSWPGSYMICQRELTNWHLGRIVRRINDATNAWRRIL